MGYDDWKTRTPAFDHGCPRCGRDGDYTRRMCVCEASGKELFQWMDGWTDSYEDAVLTGDEKGAGEALKQLAVIEDEIDRRGL